jgi:hypothetical protein
LLTSVGLWAPFVIVAGPGTIWRQTFGFATGAANDLPFPFPIRYTGTFDALGVLRFYQPVLMLAGLGLGLLMAVSQRRRLSAMAPVGLAVVGVPYLIAGPLSPRYVPLSVCVVLLLATVGLAPPRRFAPSTVAAVAVIGLITVASIDLWRIKQQTPPFAPLSGAIADGVETTPAEVRDVERVVRYVDARVARGRPVFVANPTHDDVLVGNALLNVLLQRPNPTHYVFLQQGLTTTAPVQREIIADLERTKPTIVVRWLSPFAYIRASKKPGARLLDLYLRAHYHGVARFGEFEAQRRGLDPAVSGLLGRPDTGASP